MGEQVSMFGEDDIPVPTAEDGCEEGGGRDWFRYQGPPLHRIHAGVAAGRGGASIDVAGLRWRGDGRMDNKREVARRLAVCWNVLAGYPTEALEAGAVGDVDRAVGVLLDVLAQLDELPQQVLDAAQNVRRLIADSDGMLDLANGRVHDCEQCLLECEEAAGG